VDHEIGRPARRRRGDPCSRSPPWRNRRLPSPIIGAGCPRDRVIERHRFRAASTTSWSRSCWRRFATATPWRGSPADSESGTVFVLTLHRHVSGHRAPMPRDSAARRRGRWPTQRQPSSHVAHL